MFLTIDFASSLIRLITLLMTYFWLIPLLGFFRAWVAKKMGDSTPEMLGFLTLDPFMHTDMAGLIFLCLPFFGVGWGAAIPIYLSNIDGRYPNLKRACALFSDAFLSFVIATATVTGMVMLGYSYNQVLLAGNQAPSPVVAFFGLLTATLRLSMFLMIISFVNNLATFIVWLLSRRTSFYNPHLQMLLIFGPLVMYLFFGQYLFQLFFLGVSSISTLIIRLFGMH